MRKKPPRRRSFGEAMFYSDACFKESYFSAMVQYMKYL